MINLEWLRTFRAVYRTKSLSRAAEILSISQPTVSQQLSNLEGHLGEKLFVRKSKGVLETDEGRLLNTLVSGSIESLEEVEHLIVKKKSSLRSILSIGISPHLFSSVLSDHISKLGSYVHVQFGNRKSLITEVEEGRLLYAIIPGDSHTFDIISQVLFEQELVLVSTPDLDLTEVLEVYKQDKFKAEKLLIDNNWYAHDSFIGFVKLFWMHVFDKKRPAIIPNVIIPNEIDVLKQLSKDSGLCVCSAVNAERFVENGQLIKWNFKRVPFRELSLISNKKKASKSVTEKIYQLLLE